MSEHDEGQDEAISRHRAGKRTDPLRDSGSVGAEVEKRREVMEDFLDFYSPSRPDKYEGAVRTFLKYREDHDAPPTSSEVEPGGWRDNILNLANAYALATQDSVHPDRPSKGEGVPAAWKALVDAIPAAPPPDEGGKPVGWIAPTDLDLLRAGTVPAIAMSGIGFENENGIPLFTAPPSPEAIGGDREECAATECRCSCHRNPAMVHMMACCQGECSWCGKFVAEGCEKFRSLPLALPPTETSAPKAPAADPSHEVGGGEKLPHPVDWAEFMAQAHTLPEGPGPKLYVARCGYCGETEGMVDPNEVCRDSTEEDMHPHRFGVFDLFADYAENEGHSAGPDPENPASVSDKPVDTSGDTGLSQGTIDVMANDR